MDQGRKSAVQSREFRRSRSRLDVAALACIEMLENRLMLSASVPAFQPPTPISTGGTPSAIVTDDFNEDGNEDIAITNSASNNVGVLLGNGDGTFAAPANYAVGSDPTAIATGDVNNDGNDDIVTADAGSGDVSILLANADSNDNPDGTFAPAESYHVESGGQGPLSLVMDDFNNDGNEDIAVAGAGGLYVLLGNGDGTFQAPVKISSDPMAGIVSGDFNQDGNEDIAATNPTAGTVEIFDGNGDGTFAAPISQTVSPGVTGIATGDFNNDGVTDLAVTVAGQKQVDILLGDSTTITEPVPTPIFPIFPIGVTPLASVVSTGTNSASSVSTGPISIIGGGGSGGDYTYTQATGTFASPIAIPISGTPTSITVADVNGDGNDDLVVSNGSSNAVTVIPGNGDGTFGAPVDIPMSASPTAVAADDFNNDGGIDLATANAAGSVSVALQQSSDVGVTLTASSPTVALGSDLTYTETVTNSGPGTATNVTLSDYLPTGATLVSATSSQGTVDTTTNSGEADATLGDLANGASATVTIVVQPTSYGTLNNSVSINSDSVDPNYDNNYASVSTPVVGATGAEVGVAVTGGNYFARVGEDITDSFTVTNNGPDSATGLTFTDSLSSGATCLSSSTSAGAITASSAAGVTASLGDLANGASATISITYKAATAGQYTDTGTVAAADPSTDPYTADNTATADTYVYSHGFPHPIPFLPIDKIGNITALAGGTATGIYKLAPTTPGGTSAAAAAGPAGALPSIGISNVKQRDVTKGTTNFTFTVTRAGNLASSSSVRYQTVSGTAKSGVAFQAASGEITFAAGVAQATVSVPVNGSKTYSANESFVVALTGAKNARLKESRATGTIVSAVKKNKVSVSSKTSNPAAGGLNINFEPVVGPAITGYLEDSGLTYGSRGNGLTYGWSSLNTADAVTRSGVKDPRLATFNLLGAPGATSWQIARPNGKYTVEVAAGDSTITTGTDSVDANGTPILTGKLTTKHPFVHATETVDMTDGALTLTDASSTAVPLDFVKIKFKG
jgi:uncharacterized repeat protein (TIGR01451 family)